MNKILKRCNKMHTYLNYFKKLYVELLYQFES